MVMRAFFSGVFVKLITGLDDTVVHLPVISSLTRTKTGRLAFATGIFLAICLAIAILISILFASAIRILPYYNYVSAGLIFLLAVFVHFNFFKSKKEKTVKKGSRVVRKISNKRILKLIGIGFLTAFATVIDDTLAYSSLFLNKSSMVPAIAGILYATTMELFVIISFSKKLDKIKYKKQITTIGLLILSILIFFNVL
jgi:magnesium-transporting ATPase (P-type)